MKKQFLFLASLFACMQFASAQKMSTRDSLAASLEVWVNVPVVTPV